MRYLRNSHLDKGEKRSPRYLWPFGNKGLGIYRGVISELECEWFFFEPNFEIIKEYFKTKSQDEGFETV